MIFLQDKDDVNNYVRLESTKRDEIKKELMEKFPLSFRDKNPVPVHIDYMPKYIQKVELYAPGNTDMKVRTEIKTAPPSVIPDTGWSVDENNVRYEVRWSRQNPQKTSNGWEFPLSGRKIVLKHGYQIDANKDLELLMFLWKFSGAFSNNANPSKNARFMFRIPEAKAEKTIAAIETNYKYDQEILIPSTRMSSEDLGKICAIMGIKIDNMEDADARMHLRDKVLNNAKIREQYERVKPEVLQKGSKRDLTKIGDVIKTLKDRGILVEKEGYWVTVSKNGAVTNNITQVKGSGWREQKFELQEYLATDPVMFEKLAELSA